MVQIGLALDPGPLLMEVVVGEHGGNRAIARQVVHERLHGINPRQRVRAHGVFDGHGRIVRERRRRGTAASRAASIATADHGIISRVIVGQPAVALLIAIKLLSGILEHGDTAGVAPLPRRFRPGRRWRADVVPPVRIGLWKPAVGLPLRGRGSEGCGPSP
jgi:hypothetical protein